MTDEELAGAVEGIRRFIPDFDYNAVLTSINDKLDMKRRFQTATVGYDKLQLFRVFNEVHHTIEDGDEILRKFVNESFHIENEYVMQLNPHTFDNVPEYVVQECDRMISVS